MNGCDLSDHIERANNGEVGLNSYDNLAKSAANAKIKSYPAFNVLLLDPYVNHAAQCSDTGSIYDDGIQLNKIHSTK